MRWRLAWGGSLIKASYVASGSLVWDPISRKSMDGALDAWSKRPLAIVCTQTNFPPSPYSFTPAQYELHSLDALKTKLGQFPPGTRFLWSPSEFATSVEVEDFFKALSEFATQDGIQLQRALLLQ